MLGLSVAKGVAPYAVAKAGVIQLTKALALELAFRASASTPSRRAGSSPDSHRDYLASEQGAAIKLTLGTDGGHKSPRDSTAASAWTTKRSDFGKESVKKGHDAAIEVIKV